MHVNVSSFWIQPEEESHRLDNVCNYPIKTRKSSFVQIFNMAAMSKFLKSPKSNPNSKVTDPFGKLNSV